MNTKSTFTMLIIVLVLIIGAFFYHRRQKAVIADAAIPQRTLHTSVTSSTVERIEIAAPNEPLVSLTRKSGKWYTDVRLSHEADPGAVNGIFAAMNKDIDGEVVSENPESFPDYQVDDTSGTRVKIFENGKPAPAVDLIVGKDGPTAFSTYVREGDGKEVINARATLGMTFKKPDGWRDKRIFDFSGSQARNLEEDGTSSTFKMVKEKDTWKFQSPEYGAAKDTAVSSIVNSLGSLRTDKFPERGTSQPLSDFGLEPPFETIRFTYEDSATSPSKMTSMELRLGNEKNGEYYAMRSDKSDIYTINDYIVRNLLTDPKTLAANPPAETTATASETTPTAAAKKSGGEAHPPQPKKAEAHSTGTANMTGTSAAAPQMKAHETPEATPEATPPPTPKATPKPAPKATPADSATLFNRETSVSTTLKVKPAARSSVSPPSKETPADNEMATTSSK